MFYFVIKPFDNEYNNFNIYDDINNTIYDKNY